MKKYNLLGFLQVASSAILLASSMLIATFLIIAHELTMGEFVSSLTGVQSLASQLLSLVVQFPKLAQNSRYTDDYKMIVNYHPAIETHAANDEDTIIYDESQEHTIEFRNVFFKYPTCENFVLNDVSFTVNSKQKIAIVGENGAGKTTIIKLLLRLYDPTDGEILFDGYNIKTIPIVSWRKRFTSIFQNYNLYSISLQKNIWFNSTGDTSSLLSKVGFGNRFNTTDWDRTISKQFSDDGIVLSGGEAQRLCIARALGKKAPIILLDEPSSALDPIIEDEMIKVLLEEAKNKTMLIITHRLSMCTLTDMIIYLDNGRIIEQGTHSQLIKTQGKYYRLFTTQAEKYSLSEE